MSASPSPRGSIAVAARQRRSAVRYTNLEKATSSPILTKPNRTVEYSGSVVLPNIVGITASMQGWRKSMEDRHAITTIPWRQGSPGAALDVDVAAVVIGVFDGHRGTEAAQFSSELVPQAIEELLVSNELKSEILLNEEKVTNKYLDVDATLRRMWEDHSLRSSRAGSEANAQSPTNGLEPSGSQSDCNGSLPPSGQSSPQELNISTIRAPPSLFVGGGGPSTHAEFSSITGTTAIVAVVTNDAYTFVNVGDSRSYLVSRRQPVCLIGSGKSTQPASVKADDGNDDNEKATPQLPDGLVTKATSVDHRASNVAEARRIELAGGYIVNGRVNGKLSVTRALGDFDLKTNLLDALDNPVICAPDIVRIDRKDNELKPPAEPPLADNSDTTTSDPRVFEYDLLVLGCDGIWELQSIDSIALRVDIKLQSLAPILCSDASDDVAEFASRVEAALKDIAADTLLHCCATSCDQHGSSLGADNMSIGLVLLKK